MLVSAALLCAAVLSPSLGSRYNTVGHRNERQFVQLKSQFDLSPGAALVLPVEVRPQSVGLFGRLPPRLTGITSVNPDNIYGAGDTILVTLAFASDVLVIGAPSLTLNTGAHRAQMNVRDRLIACRLPQRRVQGGGGAVLRV